MKRSAIRILGLLLACVLLFGALPAYADTPINNQIKGASTPAPVTSSSGRELLATASNWKKIDQPLVKEYFSYPFIMYVNAPAKHSIITYDSWAGLEPNKIGSAFHGSRVTVLAEHGDYYCILYYTEKNVRMAAWVRAELLDTYYPGEEISLGYGSYRSGLRSAGDPTVSWSKQNFVGARQKFTVLDYSVSNCVRFTLDYQVTARNGSQTADVLGPRDVYVNDGSGWVYVGSFDCDDLHTPAHVIVTLSEPMTLAAVATVANCSDPGNFSFRQSVLDVMCTN